MTTRDTQRDRVLALLKSGREVALPELLRLGVAQYNARILELRRMGYQIENRTERVAGETHSWFRLIEESGRLFPDIPESAYHRDLG